MPDRELRAGAPHSGDAAGLNVPHGYGRRRKRSVMSLIAPSGAMR